MKSKLTFTLSLVYILSACGSQSNPQVTSLGATDTPQTTTTGGATAGIGSGNGSGTGTSSGSTSGTVSGTASGSASGSSTALTGTIALVFSGNGACTEGCAQAGVDAATAAGLTAKEVTGNELTASSTQAEIDAFFHGVRVWIMPGGVSNTELATMSTTMKTALTKFIYNGGGYVGWCAGAFAATGSIGTISSWGLGNFPGDTTLFTDHSTTNSYGASIEKLSWEGASHSFYLEGGPYISNLGPTAESIATYADGAIAAARAPYGKGRVFISGVHPEAPTWWWQGTSVTDPDGSDVAYAVEMIKWASSM